MTFNISFPFYKQLNAMDCGPTCLRMIAKYYGKHYNIDTIRRKSGFGKEGISMLGISKSAEKMGFTTSGVQIDWEKLPLIPLPAIVHWNQNHFVVLVSINKKSVKIADPAKGIVVFKKDTFLQHWVSNEAIDGRKVGSVLLLEPTHDFYYADSEKKHDLTWTLVTQYLRQNQWGIVCIFITLFIGSLLQLILPLLTQTMVDTGIGTGNMQYVTLVLIAQLVLVFSSTMVSFIRNRIQLRISNSINLSLLSDFWSKITRLPLSYFDMHQTGDTLQRIGDNRQLQTFITGQGPTIIFSMLNLVVYAGAFIWYSPLLFGIFIIGSLLYFGWIRLFLPFRRKINYETFFLLARENNATLQLVQGMQEIRLNNAEQVKRWEWENIQASIFKLNFKNLNYDQWQSAGALFINQGKDILMSFLVAQLVIKGELTFGAMLAVQYIVGQLNAPLQQFIGLVQNVQDAKISMERLNEVHGMDDEEPAGKSFNACIPENRSITINHLSFAYPGEGNNTVLKNISISIPEKKVTAIVGASGSGKTTLLKLLLKIYQQYNGEIKIGESNFKDISPAYWRRHCGAVLQDGYIFNDTITGNIVVGEESVNHDRLLYSCRVANILSFVEALPNGLNTRLGADGIGISQGQRQRLLIARAIYKMPEYLFFDEATNSLDTNNEKAIVENLEHFFHERTVIVVAHRLSTVKNADKIIVLHEGEVDEEGTHAYLTSIKGRYYELVKNQLELGS